MSEYGSNHLAILTSTNKLCHRSVICDETRSIEFSATATSTAMPIRILRSDSGRVRNAIRTFMKKLYDRLQH